MHGQKIKMAITLIMLLGLGMVLVNYVVVVLWQNESLRCETKAAEANIELIRKIYGDENLLMGKGGPEKGFLASQGISAVVLYSGKIRILTLDSAELAEQELQHLAHRVQQTGSRVVSFLGTIWGVFFSANEFVAVGEPLSREKHGKGGEVLIVVRSLAPVYQQIMQGQRFVFFYIAINIIVLAFIGFYRLLLLTIRPIERIADISEIYRSEEELSLFNHPDLDELGRLSRGINYMLRRIEENRQDLRSTVESLRSANKELRETRNEMMRAEKMASIGRLSAGLAHEIGNPLAIVQGYHELLAQDGLSDDERKEFVHNSEKELKRVNLLIRQLLDFARSNTSCKNIIHLHQLLLELSHILSPQPVMAGITLECCFEADFDVVWGDNDQLWQVFLNCLMNAADAIAENKNNKAGRIIISTGNVVGNIHCTLPDDQRILVSIRDNGAGLAVPDTEVIFDPFFTTKQPGKGTGLGLTVSHTIIGNHGGNIYAHTPKDGGGAEIIIELPLYRSTSNGDVIVSPSEGVVGN